MDMKHRQRNEMRSFRTVSSNSNHGDNDDDYNENNDETMYLILSLAYCGRLNESSAYIYNIRDDVAHIHKNVKIVKSMIPFGISYATPTGPLYFALS